MMLRFLAASLEMITEDPKLFTKLGQSSGVWCADNGLFLTDRIGVQIDQPAAFECLKLKATETFAATNLWIACF